ALAREDYNMSRSKFDTQKYHRHSIRLSNYDYSQPGAYFVTIVTWHRECLFGEVVNGEMRLNKFGLLAKQQWEKLPKRFPNIELGAFVIMPNHAHGNIVIVAGRGTAANQNDPDGELSRRAPTYEQFQKPVRGSIPTIIRSYKSAVSYRINLMRGTQDIPVWQRNYYEHVIRNERDLQNITDYIEANLRLWGEDDENPVRAV
ncbi:MAG TPA: transposase, partial [Anaerolineales bacterium]|nr:transposase [Anaerolineales bacterium]